MQIPITFRPLDKFPAARTKNPRRATFRSAYLQTLRLLDHELAKLGATSVVIQVDCEPSEIRRDGMPRAGARMRSQFVVVSFDTRKGPLSFPCDAFDAWTDNLRAIALGLEALRAVDRYGVTRNAEQYQGWARLGGPAVPEPEFADAPRGLRRSSVSFVPYSLVAPCWEILSRGRPRTGRSLPSSTPTATAETTHCSSDFKPHGRFSTNITDWTE